MGVIRTSMASGFVLNLTILLLLATVQQARARNPSSLIFGRISGTAIQEEQDDARVCFHLELRDPLFSSGAGEMEEDRAHQDLIGFDSACIGDQFVLLLSAEARPEDAAAKLVMMSVYIDGEEGHGGQSKMQMLEADELIWRQVVQVHPGQANEVDVVLSDFDYRSRLKRQYLKSNSTQEWSTQELTFFDTFFNSFFDNTGVKGTTNPFDLHMEVKADGCRLLRMQMMLAIAGVLAVLLFVSISAVFNSSSYPRAFPLRALAAGVPCTSDQRPETLAVAETTLTASTVDVSTATSLEATESHHSSESVEKQEPEYQWCRDGAGGGRLNRIPACTEGAMQSSDELHFSVQAREILQNGEEIILPLDENKIQEMTDILCAMERDNNNNAPTAK